MLVNSLTQKSALPLANPKDAFGGGFSSGGRFYFLILDGAALMKYFEMMANDSQILTFA